MIPTDDQIQVLWDTYDLPPRKRTHCSRVAVLADFIARKLREKNPEVPLDTRCIHAAAMLHDIDKNVPKNEGEAHPDAGVRILKSEGMDEVAAVVATHPLHAILDPSIAPKTLEEKIVFCADKMVKDDVIGVEERFNLWRHESLPPDQYVIINDAYPLVLSLKEEIEQLTGVDLDDVDELRNAVK